LIREACRCIAARYCLAFLTYAPTGACACRASTPLPFSMPAHHHFRAPHIANWRDTINSVCVLARAAVLFLSPLLHAASIPLPSQLRALPRRMYRFIAYTVQPVGSLWTKYHSICYLYLRTDAPWLRAIPLTFLYAMNCAPQLPISGAASADSSACVLYALTYLSPRIGRCLNTGLEQCISGTTSSARGRPGCAYRGVITRFNFHQHITCRTGSPSSANLPYSTLKQRATLRVHCRMRRLL